MAFLEMQQVGTLGEASAAAPETEKPSKLKTQSPCPDRTPSEQEQDTTWEDEVE